MRWTSALMLAGLTLSQQIHNKWNQLSIINDGDFSDRVSVFIVRLVTYLSYDSAVFSYRFSAPLYVAYRGRRRSVVPVDRPACCSRVNAQSSCPSGRAHGIYAYEPAAAVFNVCGAARLRSCITPAFPVEVSVGRA